MLKQVKLFELVSIETNKDHIKFAISGEHGSGSILIKANDSDKKDEHTIFDVDEPVLLSFALRYLNLFNKAGNLSPTVSLMLSGDSPLVVEYKIEKMGSLRYYLAPKISDEES